MTEKEHVLIKERSESLLKLFEEKRMLEEILKSKKIVNEQELENISMRLEAVYEILDDFCILSYGDVFDRLSREFEGIRSDTNKKLYFLYAFLREDTTKDISNYIPLGLCEYFKFVPRSSKDIEYVWYKDIISMEDKVIPIGKRDDFESKNYIVTGSELPLSDELEYHKMRLFAYHGITDDIFKEEFEKYRSIFFRMLVKSSTEEEAIDKTYLRYDKKRILSKKIKKKKLIVV